MADILWTIIVQPLVYMIELVFSLCWRLTANPGIAIIGVSMAVNLFCLPLYRMADDAQEKERAKQASMERWVTHIKKHFSGDEQYMMLSAYYAEQGYHPIQALVGSLSLLFQIPFFMAAYSYLSNLELLKGVSFLFLKDLGSPDAMFTIAGFTVNVMPIAMTLLNCASTAVYTRNLPLRDKVQAYGLAAVFLVLLYDSPSGLVFYWTCNQIFSLAKNIFMKVLKDPRTWALLLEQAGVCVAAVWAGTKGLLSYPKAVLLFAAVLGVFELIWLRAWRTRHDETPPYMDSPVGGKTLTAQFALACLAITLLLGVLIPSAVMGDSPTEFVDVQNLANPLGYIVHTGCVWLGLVLWVGTFYLLSPEQARPVYGLASWLVAGACLVDYFAFGEGLGTISTTLVYDGGVSYTSSQQLVNLVALAAVAVAMLFVWKRLNRFVTPALAITAAAITALIVPNVMAINKAYVEAVDRVAADDSALIGTDGSLRTIYHLSSTDQNVVIIFLDRAISGYLPYIMAERPELEAKFDGFTYYPNTISYGSNTNLGAPALYGGYEYTPSAINERDDQTLPEKHDEALLVLPTLFSELGYRSTIIDPPYAGTYAHIPDLSIYDKLENTEALYLKDVYTGLIKKQYGITSGRDMNWRFTMYGLFKSAPELMRAQLYDGGNYLTTDTAHPTRSTLLSEYAALSYLPLTTDVTEGAGGFLQICNETTHEPDILQLPDYTPADNVDNEGLEDMSRFTLNGKTVRMDGSEDLAAMRLGHYHVNATALLKLAEWFDWMREQGVYDNTRIIIVSDHGRGLDQFEGWEIDSQMNVENVNPLFMVKDFDAHGFSTSDEFMTNADVPTMALEGLVNNPTNPFTGVAITSDEKTAHDQLVTGSLHWDTVAYRGTTFDTSDAPWYAVHDNIFDLSNWTRLEGDEQ